MGVSCVNGPARCMAPDEPKLYVACSRWSVAWKLHSIPIASHKNGKFHWNIWHWGSSSKVTTWKESFHLRNFLSSSYISYVWKETFWKKGCLGDLKWHLAGGISLTGAVVWEGQKWAWLSGLVKKHAAQNWGKKKIKLYFLLCCWYFFLVLKSKSTLNLQGCFLFFFFSPLICFSILTFQSLWTDL